MAPNVSYNWIVRTCPLTDGPHDHYDWHVELLPRLTRFAGYELATGGAINPLSPEAAARRYREEAGSAASS